MGKTTEKMHLRGFFCGKTMKILKIGERDRRDMLKTMLILFKYFCIIIYGVYSKYFGLPRLP